jgi:hypothetical protein
MSQPQDDLIFLSTKKNQQNLNFFFTLKNLILPVACHVNQVRSTILRFTMAKRHQIPTWNSSSDLSELFVSMVARIISNGFCVFGCSKTMLTDIAEVGVY